MNTFWTWYGALVLGATVVGAAWLVLVPGARRRARAGGRLVWPVLVAGVLVGLGGLASGRYTDGSALPVLPGFVFGVFFMERHRRRLALVDPETLAPAVGRFVAGPSMLTVLRHPIVGTRRNLILTRAALSRRARREEREWDRARGLR